MILDIKGVTKIFRSKGESKIVANDNITFSINEGEIFGLLGHNGAGKTTLVNQILGLLSPDHGDIHLLGESVMQSSARARSICSVQPQSQVSLGLLTPKQAVTLIGKMRMGKKFEPKRVGGRYLKRWIWGGLGEYRRRKTVRGGSAKADSLLYGGDRPR
ncbi:ATP-binding cassette domain-containing protein [Gracilibacillus sp. JCM 18860]|uniref:ATP-binding cassette domain-containing protein n=1 Tax=Gracilibacillus sp. JCM 18860 TaxID=1306159 RepID=UPI000B05F8A8